MALSDAASLFSVTPNPNADDPSQIVLEATRALLADPRLDTVLPKLLQLARQYIPADAHAVWRHFAAEERWAVLASAGLSKNYQNQFEPAGQTITETVIVPDIKKLPPLVERRRVHYEAEGIRALVVAPIRLRAGVGGTLVFYFHQPHEFSTHELKLVDTLADLAALAIETAESYEALEREKTHSQLLAEASAILSSSLDYEKTLASMARIAVPGIADWCAIDVQEDDHSIRRLAVQHADPAKVRFVLEMGDRYPPDEHYGVQQVFRSGHSILAPELTDEMLQIVAREPEHLDMLRAIGMKSAMLVPLIAHQRTLGVITLVMAESGRHFNQNDLKFVEDLARRAAVAVDNALLHTQLQTSERELASAVELLGLAQEASRVATWEWNMLTGELRWGPGSAPVFGVSSKELTTINETRNRIHPEDRELVFQQVDLAEQPPEAYDSQFRVIWPDGSIRWLSGRGRVVLGESGQATKMLGLCMDITERKVAETALKEREEQFRTLADSRLFTSQKWQGGV
jgi:PAS domain S-box-containing protein